MKRVLFYLLLLCVFLPIAATQAQGQVAAIETLTVELWPDFDRAAVLTLVTGTLPVGTALPATVTLPLADEADFNVVARIDADDGAMKDDIEFDLTDGSVTFTTPDLQFRLEYYFPYVVEEDQRRFNFTWLADLAVNELKVSVQQPTAATSLLTEPATMETVPGQDGFTYHALPIQVVPAGQPFSVRVDYTMRGSQLSAQRSGPAITDVQTTGFTSTVADPAIDWPIIAAAAGGFIIVLALTWQIASARASSRPRKPRPMRVENKSATNKYCHNCGQSLHRGDKFCRECGTAAKGG